MKTTRVANLAGRVIESVTILSRGGVEDPFSIEIRCVGGAYFSVEVTAQIRTRAHVLLATDRKGELRDQRSRDFISYTESPWNIPEEGDEE